MDQESSPTPQQQRRNVLAPYLIRLKALRSGHATLDGVRLDAWERGIVERHGSASGEEWFALVAEGLAFRKKYADDMHRLTGSDAQAEDIVRAQLVTDAAVGLALMAETQRSVTLMVLSGEIDVAKKLAGFRNKLVQDVSTIKKTIGESAFQGAQTISKRMTAADVTDDASLASAEPASDGFDPEVPHSGEPLDVDTLIKELPDTIIRRSAPSAVPVNLDVAAVDEGGPRRIKGLLIVLAALVAVWSVLILPKLGGGEPLPLLTKQQMPQNGAIRELVARPPSLFVEVDGAEWMAMSRGDRRQLVKEIGGIAAASGYTGVQFRDTYGSSVAQWLDRQGVWLASATDSN